MKLLSLSTWALSLAALTSAAPEGGKGDLEAAAAQKINRLADTYTDYIQGTISKRKTGCTSKNIVKRREWGTLSKRERQDYIDAVYCLQKKAPISKATIPGSQSRYDDFAGTHILQTPFVHFDGLFLHFHRYFVWLYEKALREECGYSGYQPYWDWTLSWKDQRKSTVFDGSPWSLGSNGKTIPHGPTNISAFGIQMTINPGTGGGCVYSGPFTPDKYTVSLGPIAFEPYGPDGGLGYNPRCLKRDISAEWSNNTRPTKVLDVLETPRDIGAFDTLLEDINGVHAGGHFSIGSLGLDAFASAGDPAFWLHHAQVDRTWAIWQSLNPNRTYQTAQTGTAFNNPPSDNVTLDTLVDFGLLAAKQKIQDISSSIDGPFCYIYV